MVLDKISGLSCYTLLVFCIATLFVFFVSSISYASPFRFSGVWGYDQTKNQGQDDFFTQTYGATFNRQVNQAIRYNGDVRYSSSWREDSPKLEVWTPSLNIALVNDFFQVGLSGSSTERMEQQKADYSNRFWESSFTSRWRKKFMPGLRFNFGQNLELDEEVPKSFDTQRNNGNANVDWDIAIGKITYNYRWQDHINDVALTEDKTKGHFAKFDTSRSFLANRLRVNFSQTYSEDDIEYISTTGAPGTQLLPLTFLQDPMAEDDTTPLNNSDVLPLDQWAGLSDLITNATAFTVPTGQTINFVLNVNLSTYTNAQVDKIYLYTTNDITTVTALQFQWDLYSNTNLSSNWNIEASNIIPVYNETERRFEFDIVPGLTDGFIKLVTTSTPPSDIEFSEIEAYYNYPVPIGTAFSIETKTQTNKTDFGFNYRFSEKLRAAYSLFYEASELSTDVKTDQSSHAGSVNWKPSVYFDSSLRASLTENDPGTGVESSGRTYSFDVSSPPLPTVDLNYGVVRSESYTDNIKESTSHGYHINSAAQLYEDLTANLDLNYTTSANESTGSESKNFDSRLNLTSRFSPQFAVNLSASYNNSKSQRTVETVSSDLTINWRISDKLLVQGSGNQRWQDETPDQRGGNMKVVLAITPKCQVDLNYNVADLEDTRQDAGMNIRWNINKFLSAQFNSGYRIYNDIEDWNMGLRITAALGSS